MLIKKSFFKRFPSSLAILVLVHCLVFSMIALVILPNLDKDMFENYAWGQTFEWGSFKHPPFFVWMTSLWFSLWPTNPWSYFLLSYFNAALGLWGVLCLSRLLYKQSGNTYQANDLQQFLVLVLGFSVLGLPFNLYASVFNADTILLSLWPWTAFVFFKSLYAKETLKKWGLSLLLGLLCASCLLGKYYSVVLFLSLFLISLSFKPFRKWYCTPFPYISFLIMILLFFPHVFWEYQMDFPFRTYYSQYLNLSFGKLVKNALVFLTTGFYFFALAWIAWGYLKRNLSFNTKLKPINNYLLLSLSLLPVLLTIILSLVMEVGLKNRWAIPAWFALPILMANQLVGLKIQLERLGRFWMAMIGVIGLLFAYNVWFSYSFLEKQQDYIEARKEMVLKLNASFKRTFPNKELSWVAGSVWPDNIAPVAFYLPNHPRALPGLPDQMPALVNPHATWDKEIGAIICGKRYSDSSDVIKSCVLNTEDWLKAKQIPIRKSIIKYRAHGWRWYYLDTPEKEVVVFWVKA